MQVASAVEQALPDVKQQLTQLRNQLEEVSEEVYSRGEVRCTACIVLVIMPFMYCLAIRGNGVTWRGCTVLERGG